jgi:hypothetical protein
MPYFIIIYLKYLFPDILPRVMISRTNPFSMKDKLQKKVSIEFKVCTFWQKILLQTLKKPRPYCLYCKSFFMPYTSHSSVRRQEVFRVSSKKLEVFANVFKLPNKWLIGQSCVVYPRNADIKSSHKKSKQKLGKLELGDKRKAKNSLAKR